MKNIRFGVSFLAFAILAGLSYCAQAEQAPVYDADNFATADAGHEPPEQQFQDIPPPAPEVTIARSQRDSQPAEIPYTPPAPTLEQRIKQLEQELSASKNSAPSPRVESLQAEVQSLRGQIEQLTHQLEQTKNQQNLQYADLDKRLNVNTPPPADDVSNTKNISKTANKKPEGNSLLPAVETQQETLETLNRTNTTNNEEHTPKPKPLKKPAKKLAVIDPDKITNVVSEEPDQEKPIAAIAARTPASTAAPSAKITNTASEQQLYQTAYNQIKAKKYAEAIKALKTMLQNYPNGQFAANAYYWQGELYSFLGNNKEALHSFSTLVQKFPSNSRLADTELKIGLIYASQFQWPEAKSSFKRVASRYVGTSSAKLARDQLKQIKLSGH